MFDVHLKLIGISTQFVKVRGEGRTTPERIVLLPVLEWTTGAEKNKAVKMSVSKWEIKSLSFNGIPPFLLT